MRAFLILALSAVVATAAEPTASQKLRAKAALALAFAPPSYAEQHAKALKEGKPLIVFVGLPTKSVAGCICISCDSFPDVAKEGIVIGFPDGTAMRRVDLGSSANEESIRTIIAGTVPGNLLAKLPSR